MFADQQYRRDYYAQALENLGYDVNTIDAGFEHARILSRRPEIWDRIRLVPNSGDVATTRPSASEESSVRITTVSVTSSLLSGSPARYTPTRMMVDRLANVGIAVSSQSHSTADGPPLSDTEASAGSAPPVPSLPTSNREYVVDTQALRRSRDDYDRISPGDSFSNPTNDQVPDASHEAVASNEITSQEAGDEIQSQEWGEAVASNAITSQEAADGIQFQESGEAVASNEITSQEAADGIQSKEAVHGIQSGATAPPSGNMPATNSCCIIL
jgi:hypothetical protein